MNKLLQTTLITAIMANSAFSAQQNGGTISGAGHIDEGAVMEMEANIKATMDKNAVIHNYSIIQGPAADEITAETVVGDENKAKISGLDVAKKAEIQGTNTEKIINYDHIMEEDADFTGLTDFKVTNPTYFRPTRGGKIQGAVDTTNVTVTSEMADLGRAIDLHNEPTDVMLLTLDCQEEDKTMRLTNSKDEMKTVQANIANEVATGGGSNSHSLVVRGAFRFEGDQSRFNQDETKLTFSKSHSEIATPKSLFMRPIDVLNKSELVIDATGVEIPHNVTVVNSKFIVNKNASFIIKSGAKLLFKRLDTGYPSENPTQMIWVDGSFANPLTELNKNYYTLSFNDGSAVKFYHDEEYNVWDQVDDESGIGTEYITFIETGSGGLELTTTFSKSITKDSISSLTSRTDETGKTYYTVPLKYDQSVEIYEDPDNRGEYKTDSEDWWIMDSGNGISIGNYSFVIKSFTADEVSALTPDKKELIYAHDDVFSYSYDSEKDSWVRRNQYVVFQPGSIDSASITEDNSTWRILDLSGSYSSVYGDVTHAVMKDGGMCFYNLNETDKIFNYLAKSWGLSIGINKYFEGNKDQGLWLKNTSVDQDRAYEVAFVEKAKTNPWQTLADYGDGYSFDR